MRIAFATEDGSGLNAEVCAHFGRAPFFTFVDLDPDGEIVSVEVKENPFVNMHSPGVIPGFIREEGADVIVAAGMGPRAADLFRQWGIEPVVGAQGRVIDVLRAILAGEEFEGGLCTPHEHECGHHEEKEE